MKRINAVFILIVILIFTMIGTQIFISNDVNFSENENRNLANRPGIEFSKIMDTSFQNQLEKFISDQIPVRNYLITLRSEIKKGLGLRDIEGAYIGKNGRYFEKITNEDISIDRLNKNIEILNNLFEANENLNSYIILAPSSGNVLSLDLPNNANIFDYTTLSNNAKDRFINSSYIDIYDNLRENMSEDIYYKTDHHWTTFGAFNAYERFCEITGIEQKDYTYFKPKEVAKDFYGTLYSKVLDIKKDGDIVEVAQNIPTNVAEIDGKKSDIYDLDKLNTKDKYQVFFGGNFGQINIDTGVENEKSILVIKDSFANCFVPFILKDYGKVTIVDYRYFNCSIQKLIDKREVTDILVLYEMSNFANDKNLTKMIMFK